VNKRQLQANWRRSCCFVFAGADGHGWHCCARRVGAARTSPPQQTIRPIDQIESDLYLCPAPSSCRRTGARLQVWPDAAEMFAMEPAGRDGQTSAGDEHPRRTRAWPAC
jgi:hypothetical protein